MFERRAQDRALEVGQRWHALRRILAINILLLAMATTTPVVGRQENSARGLETASATNACCVTNVAQFRTLPGSDFLTGCDFRLMGVLTLVDTNRDLMVLQDTAGALAIHFHVADLKLRAGQFVTLYGRDCSPRVESLPDYPFRPSGHEVRNLFEAPSYWGQYYLTRMRGWLRPPVSGQYSFWIASDNSSELWLSTDAGPVRARKIAFIQRFGWVNEREWSRFPSQHSETVQLTAGESYYIEALQEQANGGDHLSVAWQGPGLEQSVIDGRYLSPWADARDPQAVVTHGILREYWTNFSAGELAGIGGARPFESALTVRELRANAHGMGAWPKPDRLGLGQPLRAEDNYRWVEAEGAVKFSGGDERGGAVLDLSDGRALVEVRVPNCDPELSKRVRGLRVRVEGVCEGATRADGTLAPGVIWASAESGISVLDSATTTAAAAAAMQSAESSAVTNRGLQGFYGTRGVVTFNDRVLGSDYIFVQEDSVSMAVALEEPGFKRHLQVGRWADLAGRLEPGKYLPVLTPLVVTELGPHAMPLALVHPLGSPSMENREGRWSELEGVVHAVNPNGTLSVVGKDWRAFFWLGQTSSNRLAHYVDATLRARGVLSLSMLDRPLLLIPSSKYVEVEKEALGDPFKARRRSVADVLSEAATAELPHRARVAGVVTYYGADSFFLQDASGGVRVRIAGPPGLEVGQTVEVVAFPTLEGLDWSLTEAMARRWKSDERVSPKALDMGEIQFSDQSRTLVRVTAVLLARTISGTGQRLELQQQQRVFSATLAPGRGKLPAITPGSRLSVTGVLDTEAAPVPEIGDKPARAQFLASLNLLLRTPEDVAMLSGPPWWTWKRTATLVGTLLAVLMVALLWVHLLRRRLELQQAAQVAFSRNVLERLEEERRRIAANLHDSLGQMLLVIKSQAIWATQGAPEESGWRERLDDIGSATSQAIDEVRRITHGLRPYQLDRLGLTQAIRTLVSRASENSSIPFASRVQDIDKVFDRDDEIHVYRIVQEAVNNIVKHSGATEATVVIKKRSAGVSLSIRDNGRGFNPAKPSAQSHDLGYGLEGIAERVRILRGTMAIDARPGEGTTMTVDIPLSISKHDTASNSFNRG